MPSTTSSSVATAWLSSTVMTPSLPTLSIASAMRLPIWSLWLEIAATCATSSWPFTGTESFLISSTTASTAFSMPIFSCIGLAPAVTLRKPSLIMVCARIVAVVVPSPATSFVLVATSRRSCAPVFSIASLSSISRTMVTPSLVTVGAPNFFSRTTLRPLGPSVMRTDEATMSMPFLRACLASTSNVTVFAICNFPSLPYLLLGLVGFAVGSDDREHVLLGHDQVLDFVDLEFVPGVLGVKHLVADLELHRHLGAVVQDPSGPHCLDGALLGLLFGGVRKHDPALGPLFLLRRLDHHTVAQRSQIHVRMPSSAEFDLVSSPQARALSTQGGRLLSLLPSRGTPLNPFGGFAFGLVDQLEGLLGLGVRDHDPGLGEVHGRRVRGVAEHLGRNPVRVQNGRDQVGLQALAAEDHLPALDTHQSHPREGSTVAAWWAGPKCPAAAIMAALSVQSSSAGMVSRARPATTSAARRRSRVLAATPPHTTTSVSEGLCSIARFSFSSSDSTTDCSKAAARSALSSSVTFSPRSRIR